jgi:hypothetical protein
MVATPKIEKPLFHVEHSPIDESTPDRWSLFYQSMYPRIDHLDRQVFGKNGGTALIPAIESYSGCITACQANAKPDISPVSIETGTDSRFVPTILNQTFARNRSKGFPSAKKIDRLQQTGLARGILAID